jgi:hypothetical protein
MSAAEQPDGFSMAAAEQPNGFPCRWPTSRSQADNNAPRPEPFEK